MVVTFVTSGQGLCMEVSLLEKSQLISPAQSTFQLFRVVTDARKMTQ